MTPRAKRQARSTRRKPYSKKEHVLSSPSPGDEDASLPPPVRPPTPGAPAPTQTDRHGYPTQAQFSEVLARYMASLHPRKAVKALIDREMYDKIRGTLCNPADHKIGNAQFRFWVRKMFTLEHVPGYDGPYSDNADPDDIPLVVVHENRPVAIKEDLYSVLCHCHSLAQHGGRDRTCAVVRSLYSYVPKVLIAAFVAACPTCQYRRTGDPVYIPFMEQQTEGTTEVDEVPGNKLPGCMLQREDVENPDIVYFGPGPEYPFHNGEMLVTHPLNQSMLLPTWSPLPLPMPNLRSHAHRGSTSSIDTQTTLMTPDVEEPFPLTLPPLHLPPIFFPPQPREPFNPGYRLEFVGTAPKVQSWDPDAIPSHFSAPSTIPSSPSKHRLPSVSQLLRMEGVDGESYVYGRGEEEDVRLPPLIAALTDDDIVEHGVDPGRRDVPIDPFLLGHGPAADAYELGSLRRAHVDDNHVFTHPLASSQPQSSRMGDATAQLPHIMVTGPAYTHSRPPPLDLSRISAHRHPIPPSISPSSISPLSSDRSNLPTGSSATFDICRNDMSYGEGTSAKGKTKVKGKRRNREEPKDDQNVGFQDSGGLTIKKQRGRKVKL